VLIYAMLLSNAHRKSRQSISALVCDVLKVLLDEAINERIPQRRCVSDSLTDVRACECLMYNPANAAILNKSFIHS